MKQITLEIIQKCSNKCLHCSSLASPNCTLRMETEKAKEVIDGAVKLHTEILSISGGEPFLHPRLREIVGYAKGKGLAVYVYTCGVVLDNAGRPGDIPEGILCNLPADKIIFDIPAVDEDIYNKFMGSVGQQKFAFESIWTAQRVGLCTEIHFVPTKINIGEADSIIRFALKHGIRRVSFLGLVPHGRALQNRELLELSYAETQTLKERLGQLQSQQVRVGIPLQIEDGSRCCYAGTDKLSIRYDGFVFGCEAFKYIHMYDRQGQAVRPDSIYERPLEKIYANSDFLKLEQAFVAQYLQSPGCGEKCPVQRMFRAAQS